MATLRLDLDTDTLERLARESVSERRPLAMQAEVILRRALGVSIPAASVPDVKTTQGGTPRVAREVGTNGSS